LAPGERFQPAIAGNHAQGTLFRDGGHLSTPALERRVDEIARSYPWLYVGRVDVRYTDVTAFPDLLPTRHILRNGGPMPRIIRNIHRPRMRCPVC
jgi:hypothetical protein